jgi:hypothetical protein
VTARTETDPAAVTLANNLLNYVSSWQPAPTRKAVYVGEESGMQHLTAAGIKIEPYSGKLSAEHVLVVGPGGAKTLASDAASIADWLKAGGNLLALGLDRPDLDFLPSTVGVRKGEHIAAFFEPFLCDSLLSGIGPADVHNRDPRWLPLIDSGATIVGDGVLAITADLNIVFCQLVPWHFDGTKQWNLKKTYRRSSFLVTRLLANFGAATSTPIIDRFHIPVATDTSPRWQAGLYVDAPEAWDDPYRFFRW